MLRHRDLVRVLPGVFVEHTGELTWIQRAWVGTLFYAPAALGKESALRAAKGPGWRGFDDRAPLTVTVDVDRHVKAVPGYRIQRKAEFDSRVQWNASPPRVRIEDAALDIAAEEATDFAALEVLAEVCRSRHSTPARLRQALDRRGRLRRRSWMSLVLQDLEEGSCSVLEHGYLHQVERAHGLPRGVRQAAAATTLGRIYRDVTYEEFGLVIELDGQLFHNNPRQRDLDLDRDLDAAIDGSRSVRLGWGQVFGRRCRTAERIGLLLGSRGWPGAPSPCGRSCSLATERVG